MRAAWRPTALLLVTSVCIAQPVGPAATKIRIPPDGGALFATVAGKERKIATDAGKAWLLTGGTVVAYSGSGGAGGFENEGQALYLYDVATEKKTKILSESFEIMNVEEAKSASGKPALLVTMEDGGLGATHIAVVDPSRGEVFRQDGAKFAGSKAGAVSVAWYKDEDWEKLQEKEAVKPEKTARYELDELLRRKTITNKRQ